MYTNFKKLFLFVLENNEKINEEYFSPLVSGLLIFSFINEYACT